jgi:hypothetical protein
MGKRQSSGDTAAGGLTDALGHRRSTSGLRSCLSSSECHANQRTKRPSAQNCLRLKDSAVFAFMAQVSS